ncbi:stealth family protein [Psychrobacter sp. AH5]|uniref:Stealth CR1 domain-containing protein n=1 Tax=Psychrobacter sp. AH5 TaxID=2937433 RepID=UPI00333FD4C2
MHDPNKENIDLVITWVDGDDPLLKQKRAPYLAQEDVASGAISATRFASNDEIYYNVASILKYVPFCRHIYIITDQQKPKFIDEFVNQGVCSADKIRIVDHQEIFLGYEQFLPTFNSLTIETMLWNISDLSDYFITLDDDFFFNQPASISDFLDQNNIIIRGHWRKSAPLKAKLHYRQLMNKAFNTTLQPKYVVSQMLGAEVYKSSKFFEIHHYPHIIDKSVIKSYFLAHPDYLNNQIKHRFRDISQFDPVSLMNHLKIKKGEAILKPNLNLNYLKNEKSVSDFIKNLDNTSMKYGCIQSMDQLDATSFKQVQSAMTEKLSSHLPSSLVNVRE